MERERLSDLTRQVTEHSSRFTAGRYLQARELKDEALKGLSASVYAAPVALEHMTPLAKAARGWVDRGQVEAAVKAAVSATSTGDIPPELMPIAASFIQAMRGFSIPLRLSDRMRRVPMRTPFYLNMQGALAVQIVPESKGIPVLKGDWTRHTMEPRKFAGILVQTADILKSPSPIVSLAIVDDLAAAVSEVENTAFLSPNETGSVLDGATTFAGTGGSLAQVDADLKRLVDSVANADKGGVFTMTKETATYLSLLRGGGAAAFPDIGPAGGELLHLPVLITSAGQLDDSPISRFIGLLSPSEIIWADEGVAILSTTTHAALEMSDSPTGATDTPVAASQNLLSLFQADAVATRAIRESNWYARAGSAAYFTTGY